jgi:serine protease Do
VSCGRAIVAAVVVGQALLPAARAAEEPLWTEMKPAAKKPALTLADLATRARPAVVHVRGTLLEPPRGRGSAPPGSLFSVGSGFFISRDGYLITNEHVVRGSADIRVRLDDGREMVACVVGSDAPTDVALLKVEPRGALPVLPLADSDAVLVGQTAVAIGSPFGFAHSVTAGIVSAKERVLGPGDGAVGGDSGPGLDADRPGGGGGGGGGEASHYAFFIQTDASINVGNSGGPLVDSQGAAIGINAAFWGGGHSAAAQGVSFAIPINIVKLLLPRLRQTGEAPRSFLGVESQPLTAALVSALDLPTARGALIASVVSGSPAEVAGLEPGDVVVGWDGRTLTTREDFKIYAQLTPPGTRVRVKVLRDGKVNERVVTTRRADDSTRATPLHAASCRGTAGVPTAPPASPHGFDAADLPTTRARGLPGGKGVEVTKVHGGPAAEAGLVARDVLLRVGRTAIRTAEDLRKALAAAPPGSPIALLVRRDGADFWTALPRR